MFDTNTGFNIFGLDAKYFLILLIIVFASVYLEYAPTVTIYSNESGSFQATSYTITIAFLMATGGFFFWLGGAIPIINVYLGGAALLPLLGASLMNHLGLVPETLYNGSRLLLKGGFQDMYIAMVLVGSVLIMDRKILIAATARYLPTILGSQLFALLFVVIGGSITGFGWKNGLFHVGAPTMSGGSGGALITIPALYSSIEKKDLSEMAGLFISYVSIANIVAVIIAAIGEGITKNIGRLNGNGRILLSQKISNHEPHKQQLPSSSSDYQNLASGIFIALCIYTLGDILGKLPILNIVPGIAWTVVLAIIIKSTNILPEKMQTNAVYSMTFALRGLLPMLITGIGIVSLNITDLTSYFSISLLIVISLGVWGAFMGAMIIGKFVGLYPYEAGVTAGLCCCNVGGSGDLAVLSAANRMNLLAFASISTRIGGALMIIWIGILYRMFM